jgi:hypothetical protein
VGIPAGVAHVQKCCFFAELGVWASICTKPTLGTNINVPTSQRFNVPSPLLPSLLPRHR